MSDSKSKIYIRSLARKVQNIPADWPPSFVFNETVTAAVLGVNRRTMLRWRRAGIGPEPENDQFWTAHGNSRFYRLSNVLSWRNMVIGEGATEPSEIELDWLARYGAVAYSIPLPPQPKPVESWRKKGEPKKTAKCRKTRERLCELQRIEFNMIQLLLRDRERNLGID